MELISDLESNIDIEDQDSETSKKQATSCKEKELPEAEIN